MEKIRLMDKNCRTYQAVADNLSQLPILRHGTTNNWYGIARCEFAATDDPVHKQHTHLEMHKILSEAARIGLVIFVDDNVGGDHNAVLITFESVNYTNEFGWQIATNPINIPTIQSVLLKVAPGEWHRRFVAIPNDYKKCRQIR